MSSFNTLFFNVFIQKIKGKMFILSTFFLLIGLTLVVLWPNISDLFEGEEVVNVGIIDNTNANISELFQDNADYKYVELIEQDTSKVDKKIKDGDLSTVITIEPTSNFNLNAEVRANGVLSTQEKLTLTQNINNVNYLYAIQELGIPSEEASKLLSAEPSIKEVNITQSEEVKDEKDRQVGTYLAYAVGFIVYLFIVSYLSMITTDIANEKGSKIMEVLVSTVSPQTHLLSKVLGLLVVGVVQLSILITYVLSLMYLTGGEVWNNFKDIVEVVSLEYFILTPIFILLSYVLYLIIGAFLGSFVTKVEEASQALLPAMALVMTGFAVMFYGLMDPEATIVKVFSYIPFTSPLVMPLRISSANISIWESLISIIIISLTILILFFLTTRLYRGAVLVYNSKSFINRYKKAWELGDR